ncbi:MAG: pilin, partial [Candidatus Altiarchaeota archaeon]|nr:pilin [Candidatus Altiarchaeota archaeon]
ALIFFIAPSIAYSSIDFKTVPCTILDAIFTALTAIGGTIVVTMFLYGGAKYAYSAEDPGARKQGKNMCIHAIIGGILIVLWETVKTILSNGTWFKTTGCLT